MLTASEPVVCGLVGSFFLMILIKYSEEGTWQGVAGVHFMGRGAIISITTDPEYLCAVVHSGKIQ
jgi:hypothetical protein